MTLKKTGNNQFLKEFNRALFLDILRQRGFISKAELAKITGLSPTAAGTIVQSLIDDEFIVETGTGESSGGRRPIMYSLRKGSYFSVGIDIDVKTANIIILDLSGEKIEFETLTLPNGVSAQNACEIIWKEIQRVILKLHISTERLLGLGISIPGIINTNSSEIIIAPNLGWENENLVELFKRHTGLKVHIENEAMASALCEHWIGCCQNINNFICINIKSGIGAGIFTDGRLYRGNGGSAGEIGHVVIDENGPKCGCGKKGCLETVASTRGIIQNALRILESSNAYTKASGEDYLYIDELIQMANTGNKSALSIFTKSAEYLGTAIAELVNTLNPTMVVLGKEFTKYSNLCMDTITRVVNEKALKYPASQVSIVASELGDQSSTIGAAILPLKKVFGK